MRSRTSHRRSPALLAAAVLVVAPALASCGFDYETDKVNTIASGVNDRDGQIDVLGAVIIAAEDDKGVFGATFANNSQDKPDTLTEIGGGVSPLTEPAEPSTPTAGASEGASEDATPTPAAPTSSEPTGPLGVLPPGGRLNLFDDGGYPVEGSFTLGDFVSVTVTFGGGQSTTLRVPVVKPCDQYSPEKLTSIEVPGYDEAESETEDGEPGPASCDVENPDSGQFGGSEEGQDAEGAE